MYPILGRYGPFFLFSYTVVMGIGIGTGIGLAAWQARRRDVSADWLDGVLIALLVGLIGGRAGFVWRKRPFIPIADLLAPSIALASAFGWLACWLEGCAYGRAVVAGNLFAVSLPDDFGVFAWRYQTQLLGMGLSLFVFAWALTRQRHWRPGQTFGLTLFALSLGRIGIGVLRGDAALFVGAIRGDVALDILLAIFSLLLLKYPGVDKLQ